MSKKSILFWDVMSLLFIIGVPSITCIWIDIWPGGVELVKSMISIAILFYPAAILSAIPYISTIGLYGTYLSFVTGNVSNIKLPCALNALGFLDENSSQEHKDCMVTVAVTISNIVTLIVLAVCVFGLFPYITDVMDLPIAPAFRQILAALFGALGVSCFTKNKMFSVILVICLVFFLIIDGTLSSTTLLVIAMSIIMVYSIVVSIIKYNKNNQREES